MRKSIALAYLVAVLLGAEALAAEDPEIRVLDLPLYGQQWNVWCWAASAQMVIDYLYQEKFQDFLVEKIQPVGTVDPEPSVAFDRLRTELALRTVMTSHLPRSVRQCEILNQRYRLKVRENIKDAEEAFCKGKADKERCLKRKYIINRKSVDCCAEDMLALKREDREICVMPGFPTEELLGSFGISRKRSEYQDPLDFEKLKGEIEAGRPVAFSNGAHMMVAAGYVYISENDKWVVIHNPFPPPNGDRYMVPYDYFESGPFQFYLWDMKLTNDALWQNGSWDVFESKEGGP